MVAVAITCSTALRMPARISGRATGASTRRTTWRAFIPIPPAASRTAGSTSRTPA